MNVSIRRGRPGDAHHWCELALYTGPHLLPYLLGSGVRNVLRRSFPHPTNCFSFDHSHFIEAGGEIAGMALAYDYREKRSEELRSQLLIMRYLKWGFIRQLPYLRRSGNILAQIGETDCYLSNIAVYPKFRRLGLGTKLIEVVEEQARKAGSSTMVLDTETDNEEAIKLYERLGYKIERKSPVLKIRDRDFQFFKMTRAL
jgi:ribosomal protein S18 acetylase RimI-like enzyme